MLSPCHLTTLPLLVGALGHIDGQPLDAKKLALWVTAGMSSGVLLTGALTLAAGRLLGDLWGIGPWLNAALFAVGGLALLDAVRLPALGWSRPDRARAGISGALAAGAMLGLSLGPCTFGFFAPVLGLATGGATLAVRVGVLLAFACAHLVTTWAAGLVGARLGAWSRRGGRLPGFAKTAAGLVALALAANAIAHAP